MKDSAKIEMSVEEALATEASSTAEVVSSPLSQQRTLGDSIGIAFSLGSLYLIWGGTYLGMRVALESFPPFIMAGTRFVLAGSILYIVMRLRGAPRPTRAQWIGSALIGILMLLGSNGSVSFAEQWVTSGISAIALGAVPLWTAFFVGLMGRWPTRLEWVGLVLGFCGVILLNLENGLWANPQGAIALLLAPICWSIGSALSSRSARISLPKGLMGSATQMLAGGAAMLLLAVILNERVHALPSMRSLIAMGFLTFFGSIVAYSSYGYLLRKVRPAIATSYAYINPIVAVALGVGLAGERITVVGLMAMLVILGSVGLLSFARKRG